MRPWSVVRKKGKKRKKNNCFCDVKIWTWYFYPRGKQEHKRCLDYCPKYSTWFMKPPWQNYRDNFTRTLLLDEINSEGKFLFLMLLDFLVWYCTHIVLTNCITLSFVLVHSSVIEHTFLELFNSLSLQLNMQWKLQ